MKKMKIIPIFLLYIFGVFHRSAAILCYFCADATGDKESADCIHKPHHLRQNRIDFESDPYNNDLKDFPYLKNCSHYVDKDDGSKEKYEFCKIQEVESHGTVNAYIRDCSDLTNFDVNITSFDKVKPDNFSLCGYNHIQAVTICIRVCTGDFCNGPNFGMILNASAFATSLLSLLTIFFMTSYSM